LRTYPKIWLFFHQKWEKTLVFRQKFERTAKKNQRTVSSEVREMMRAGLLKKAPNLGKLALHQIEVWLQSHGV